MKSVNKKINKITNLNTRLNKRLMAVLTALLIMTSFAPYHAWAAMQPAARSAGLATQQLYPTLAPAAQRLGLTSVRGTPAETQQSREAKLRKLEQERAFERRRQTTARWLEQKKAGEAREAQALQAAKLRQSMSWGQRIVGRKLGTGLMRPASSPFSGTAFNRPAGMGLGQQAHRSLSSYSESEYARAQKKREYEKSTFPEFKKDLANFKGGMFTVREQGYGESAVNNGRLIHYGGRPELVIMDYRSSYKHMVAKWGKAKNPEYQDVHDKYMDMLDEAELTPYYKQQQEFDQIIKPELDRMKQEQRQQRELRRQQKASQEEARQSSRSEQQQQSSRSDQRQQQLPQVKNEADQIALNYFNKKEGYSYQELVKKYHPDLTKNDPAKRAIMSRVNGVYNLQKEFANDLKEYHDGKKSLSTLKQTYDPARANNDPVLKVVYTELYKQIP